MQGAIEMTAGRVRKELESDDAVVVAAAAVEIAPAEPIGCWPGNR
jgi:hypothetical protein